MKTWFKYSLAVILLSFMTAAQYACSRDDLRPDDGPLGGETEVTFDITTPGGGDVSRALGSTEQDHIEEIAVMVFETGAAGKYLYTAYAKNITDMGSTNKKRFSVKLRTGTFDLMVLANGQRYTNQCYPTGISANESRVNVIKGLTVTHATQWDTDVSGTGFYIPMWGIAENVLINASTDLSEASGNAIRMLRMLSKVDVNVGAAAQTDFKLESVRVYNYNTKGQMIPDIASWNSSTGQVNAISVPTGARPTPTTPATALVYDVLNANITDVQCKDEIYIFEAEQGVPQGTTTPGESYFNNPCLVVGGRYKGALGYYRIDFKGSGTYMPIKRNNSYNVVIQSVSGPGFTDPNDALNSVSADIEASVVGWKDGEMGVVMMDGLNYMSLTSKDWVFSREQRTGADTDNKLYVDTDLDRWEFTKITTEDGNTPCTWLVPSHTSGLTGTTVVSLNTDSPNTAAADRIAIIHGEAGRLKFQIRVRQTYSIEMRLEIKDVAGVAEMTGCEFGSHVGGVVPSQGFRVDWYPQTANVKVEVVPLGLMTFNFNGGGDVITDGTLSDPSGTKVYTIQPPSMTSAEVTPSLGGMPFLEKTSMVVFSIEDILSGERISKSVVLRQFNYGIWAEPELYYQMDGSTFTLHVQSNVPWKITYVTDSDGVLSDEPEDQLVGLTGLSNVIPGTPIQITMANSNDGAKFGKVAKIRFTDLSGNVPDAEVPIKGMRCGVDGTAVALQIGKNGYSNPGVSGKSYLTHMYGHACWMVQYTREFNPNKFYGAKTYPGHAEGERGYYYQEGRFADQEPCPAGWWMGLFGDINAMMQDPVTRKFWVGASSSVVNDAAADLIQPGYYNSGSGWVGWGNHTVHYTLEEKHQKVWANGNRETFTRNNSLIPVRCVKYADE